MYKSKELAELLGVSVQVVHYYINALQLDKKIKLEGKCHKAFYSEKSLHKLQNLKAIRQKYPDLKMKELIAMNDQLEAEGFEKIEIDKADSVSKLVTDERFNTISFFPSYEEITPFQFQELEDA